MSRTSTITKHQRHQLTNSASDVCLCIRRFEKCQSGQFQNRRAIDSLTWQFNIPEGVIFQASLSCSQEKRTPKEPVKLLAPTGRKRLFSESDCSHEDHRIRAIPIGRRRGTGLTGPQRKSSSSCKCLKGMAGTTGLEPAASAVTGQRSNQLNYVPTCVSYG
jgi:hypothetical protein